MKDTIWTIAISVLSSGTVVALFTFFVKKYIDRYLGFYFDRRLSQEKLRDELMGELRKEFLTKSLQTYAAISRLTYKCLIAGRENLAKAVRNEHFSSGDNWKLARRLQDFLGEQAFIDQGDYRVIHSFKNGFLHFCQLCDEYEKKRDGPDGQAKLKDLEMIWKETVEAPFKEVQNICRLFSIRN